MTATPLRRLSVADEVAADLRRRILEGDLPPSSPLREIELAMTYVVSRHSARAALRSLASEGLVQIERNRGASVARLDPDGLQGLFELRTALELEAAHLALERHDGRLPADVHAEAKQLTRTCRRSRPSWRSVASAHAALHGALVDAANSPRIEAAYHALATELQLYLVELRPVWPLERMARHHERLPAAIEREGPGALRRHLEAGARSVGGG